MFFGDQWHCIVERAHQMLFDNDSLERERPSWTWSSVPWCWWCWTAWLRRGWQCKPPLGCSSPGREENGEGGVVGESRWERWNICHLEVADNAAPGEPRHLNSHILCLLCQVPLAETSLLYSNVTMSKSAPEQHLLQALLNRVCQSPELWALWVAQTRLPLTHLSHLDRWRSSSKYDKTHHLELSIDFIFLEDWLLFLLLFDGRLNEIVTVVCDRPHLMKLMTLMLMTMKTMKTKRKILTKKKKNYDISADHHCLSLFVLPHPGLLCRQTDQTQVSKFEQQQHPQQQHHAATATIPSSAATSS